MPKINEKILEEFKAEITVISDNGDPLRWYTLRRMASEGLLIRLTPKEEDALRENLVGYTFGYTYYKRKK